MKKREVAVFLDAEDIKYIDNICQRTGYSMSAVIRMIVKDYIRRQKNES